MNPVGEDGPIFGLGSKGIPSFLGIVVIDLSTVALFQEDIDVGSSRLIIALVRGTGLKYKLFNRL